MMTDIVAEIGDVPNKGERIILHDTLWNDKPLCQSIPGKYWSVKLAKWSYPVSWPACAVHLGSTFGDRLKIGPKLSAWAWKRKTSWTVPCRSVMSWSFDGQPYYAWTPRVPTTTTSGCTRSRFPGRDFLVTAREALLGDEMGSGKTFQTIAAMRLADRS